MLSITLAEAISTHVADVPEDPEITEAFRVSYIRSLMDAPDATNPLFLYLIAQGIHIAGSTWSEQKDGKLIPFNRLSPMVSATECSKFLVAAGITMGKQVWVIQIQPGDLGWLHIVLWGSKEEIISACHAYLLMIP